MALEFVRVEQDRNVLSRDCCGTPDDGCPYSKVLSHTLALFQVDQLGQTIYYAVQDWLVASNHDRRILHHLHLRIRGRIVDSGSNLPANARSCRRLRLHAE